MSQAQVTVTRRLEVDPHRVWSTIAAGDGLEKWLPVITACRLEGSGEGAIRHCTMDNGAQLIECIIEVDHARRVFRYSIDEHPLPARQLTGVVEVRGHTPAGSIVSWGASFDAEPPHRDQLEAMFRDDYDQAIRGLEAYLKRLA
jgi:uncharacterized protein YndB with AHSA1/START domain